MPKDALLLVGDSDGARLTGDKAGGRNCDVSVDGFGGDGYVVAVVVGGDGFCERWWWWW